jgi:hypothetical protein
MSWYKTFAIDVFMFSLVISAGAGSVPALWLLMGMITLSMAIVTIFGIGIITMHMTPGTAPSKALRLIFLKNTEDRGNFFYKAYDHTTDVAYVLSLWMWVGMPPLAILYGITMIVKTFMYAIKPLPEGEGT